MSGGPLRVQRCSSGFGPRKTQCACSFMTLYVACRGINVSGSLIAEPRVKFIANLEISQSNHQACMIVANASSARTRPCGTY